MFIKRISIVLVVVLIIGGISITAAYCEEEVTYEIRTMFLKMKGFSWYDAADETKMEFMEKYNENLKIKQKSIRVKERAEKRAEKILLRSRKAKEKAKKRRKKIEEKREKMITKMKAKKRASHKDKLENMKKLWDKKRKAARR